MRYKLQPSQKAGYQVCTDTHNGIVCVFREHDFNNDQSFTTLDDFPAHDYMTLARYIREMGEWLRQNHYNLLF